MSDLMMPLDRDSIVAAILASGNTEGLDARQVVSRYAEIVDQLQARKGTYQIWQNAYGKANPG